MSETGRLLHEARVTRQQTLADVEAATRIRQKYLLALEEGDYSALPRGTVARGFVRNYASYLGLDPDQVLELYARESGDVYEAVEIAEPGQPRLADYRPLEVQLVEEERRASIWPWVVGLLAVVLLAAALFWFVSQDSSGSPLAVFAPQPTATATSTATTRVITATPRPTESPTFPPPPTSALAQPTPTSDLLTLPVPTDIPTVTPTPRPTATPEVVAGIAMEVKIVQRSWLRAVVDDVVVQEGTLEEGDVRSYGANERLSIRTGNGGGVDLSLNGEELGLMGGVGEVVERTWVVEGDAVTESGASAPPSPSPSPDAPTPTATASG